MGFSQVLIDQSLGRQRADSEWIREPGWHTVQIAGWRYDPPRTRRIVIFELRDAARRRQAALFGLGIPTLRRADLLSFVAAAMGSNPVEHEAKLFDVGKPAFFRKLVGRRLRVLVVEGRRPPHFVLEWEPLTPPT